MIKTNFILYVADQARSTAFYTQVLNVEPTLNVPGMTEFTLADHCILGLMPEAGIKRLLGERLPDPATSQVPRAEVYLMVAEPAAYHRRALAAGAIELSELKDRDWGQRAAYSLDPDGHVLAFAEPIIEEVKS
jgi:catechol 2,3-dioxygenase-like lactoylglutathione lyase family enzyme